MKTELEWKVYKHGINPGNERCLIQLKQGKILFGNFLFNWDNEEFYFCGYPHNIDTEDMDNILYYTEVKGI